MSGPRTGSLFSGYGGLDRAVVEVLGGTVAWHCEIDPAASRLLQHHHPDVPNLGDIVAVDWAEVEPVDVLTGGFPCQDVSSAGRRLGLRPGTRSGLWEHMAYAIDQLRPELVVIENVRGLLSADAHCDVEPCPWCLGDDEGRPLRALGAVLGDLANLGYDARGGGLRAADVGAPHGRYRIFVTATPAAVGVDAGPAAVDSRLGVVGGTVRGRGVHHGSVRLPESASAARLVDDGRGRRPAVLEHDWSWSAERALRAARARHEADVEMGGVSSGRGRDASEPDVARPWGSSPCPCCGGDDGAAPPGRGDSGATADASGGQLQRRRVGGVLAGPQGAGAGEGPERERHRDTAGHGGADDPCAGCGHGEHLHDQGGWCALCPANACPSTDPQGVGRGEGRPEPTRLGGGPDAAIGGDGPVADADSIGPVRGRAARGRRAGSTDHDRAAPDADRPGPQGRGLHRPGGSAAVGDGAPAAPDTSRLGRPGCDEPRPDVVEDGPEPAHAGLPGRTWGQYEPAIRRWELILGRPAPAPTQTGARGGQQLSPRFVEWMQGLPDGWVTSVPGITRNEQLKMLGNGVVPQQAAAALRWLLATAGEVAA